MKILDHIPRGAVLHEARTGPSTAATPVVGANLGPFMDEKLHILLRLMRLQSALAELSDDELQSRAFRLKAETIAELIHWHHGKQLLALSQEQVLRGGKTWFLCLVPLDDWQKMATERVVINCMLDRYGRGHEQELPFLQKLVDMDAEHEYMLAFEIVGPKKKIMYNYTIDPRNMPAEKPPSLWSIKCSITEPTLQGKVAYKWACSHCMQIVAHDKLKLCAACREQRYCTPRCQQADWPLHKRKCPLLQQLHKK